MVVKKKSTAEVYEISELARMIFEKINIGDRIALEGPLGAGKSTFAAEIIRLYGLKYEGSPTFTYVNRYFLPGLNTYLLHSDLYRSTAFEELIENDNISLIEWMPEVLLPILKPRFIVEINKNHLCTWREHGKV